MTQLQIRTESKRTELLKLLDSNFDFDDMARSSLGSLERS